jgi:hypothetical protein
MSRCECRRRKTPGPPAHVVCFADYGVGRFRRFFSGLILAFGPIRVLLDIVHEDPFRAPRLLAQGSLLARRIHLHQFFRERFNKAYGVILFG